ncbi:MAG: histidine phosphatase family protein [Candidatus Heimdallarchaeota archaeon]|nr:histidine phosphatase family protein [Candidatus Heimdallarchaeota archaeon]MBY8993923.1 histidine phosphatase family protein [Candidatus Heimdallarchaeota archaeon]
MRFYLVRHGQSEANLHRIIAGHGEYPLTDLGKEQAKSLGQELLKKGIKFDAVYSSDILRASETANIICSEMGIKEIIFDKRLREGDAGVFEGRFGEKLTKEESEFLDSTMRIDKDVKIPDGESNLDMTIRIKEAFLEIIEKHPEDSTILIVGHGGTHYHILVRVLALLPEKIDEWFGSCKLNIIERESEKSAWKITMFNNNKL